MLLPSCTCTFSQATSLVPFSRIAGWSVAFDAFLHNASTFRAISPINRSCSRLNRIVLAMRARFTLLMAPRPDVYKQLKVQPLLAAGHILTIPLSRAGARYKIPVITPNLVPLRVLASAFTLNRFNFIVLIAYRHRPVSSTPFVTFLEKIRCLITKHLQIVATLWPRSG